MRSRRATASRRGDRRRDARLRIGAGHPTRLAAGGGRCQPARVTAQRGCHGGPPKSSTATVGRVEFQDVVLRRRMVRDFSDEPVARPLVEQLVANATHIPSAGYSQGFAFVVLTEPGQRRLFWETTSGPEWRGESESGCR